LLAEAVVLVGLAGAYRRHAEELAQSEQRFRDLFESTLDALAIHDGQRILAVNPAFEKMFRCTAEEAIGKNPLHFVAPEVREEAFKLSSEALELPQTLIRSVAQRNDGTSFAAEARVAPVTYEGRQVFAISVRDISKRLEIERALAEERERNPRSHRRSLLRRQHSGLPRNYLKQSRSGPTRSFRASLGFRHTEKEQELQRDTRRVPHSCGHR